VQLTNRFTVDVPADRLWEILTDVERIAPCVPGFELVEIAEPEYRGLMKVKVGAINMQYDAVITFVERDDSARRAVLSVRAKERRGPGDATAHVTSVISDRDGVAEAEMVTELQVTGRVAQFGRSILADVSGSLLDQFVGCLNARLIAPPAADQGPPGPVQPAAPVDLGAVAGPAIARRIAPTLAIAAVIALIVAVLVRR
jgi:carbon monoxide dehydrogenase subunit G